MKRLLYIVLGFYFLTSLFYLSLVLMYATFNLSQMPVQSREIAFSFCLMAWIVWPIIVYNNENFFPK